MALKVDFPLDEALKEALGKIKGDDSQRALIVKIDKEVLKLAGDATALSTNFANDLAKIRANINKDEVGACFVIIRVPNKGFQQVSLVPENVKPAIKMVYASSASHLRTESGLGISGGDLHITSLDELVAALFDDKSEEDKEVLMTEEEKTRKEVDKAIAEDQEKAKTQPPKKAPMAGVMMPLSEDAVAAVEKFVEGKNAAVIFSVAPKNIVVDKELASGASKDDIVAALPENQPRFAIINWAEGKDILVYVCPSGCKPREKMGYSSSKGSLVAQLNHYEMQIKKSIEMDAPAELVQQVTESLEAEQLDEVEQIKAKPAAKGFRLPTT